MTTMPHMCGIPLTIPRSSHLGLTPPNLRLNGHYSCGSHPVAQPNTPQLSFFPNLSSPATPYHSPVLPDSAALVAEWFGKGGRRKPRLQSANAKWGLINGVRKNPFNSSKSEHDHCPHAATPPPPPGGREGQPNPMTIDTEWKYMDETITLP